MQRYYHHQFIIIPKIDYVFPPDVAFAQMSLRLGKDLVAPQKDLGAHRLKENPNP